MQIYHGDAFDVLRTLPDASVDAVVTDPPYGLEFMGKEWDRFDRPPGAWREPPAVRTDGYVGSDGCARSKTQPMSANTVTPSYTAGAPYQAWCTEWSTECLRVLKPGGHLLAFGGTRTYHRLAVAIEDAGFEIRDSIDWIYGSGFPKSLDVSKAIDKAAGATREVVGEGLFASRRSCADHATQGLVYADDAYVRPAGHVLTAPATPAAQQWSGWGTALKPAHEPIVVARKPIVGTVAANVLAHGTGALNIDGCRVEFAGDADRASAQALADLRAKGLRLGVLGEPGQGNSLAASVTGDTRTGYGPTTTHPSGRWPANVVLSHTLLCDDDGCDETCPVVEMNRQGEGTRPPSRAAMRPSATDPSVTRTPSRRAARDGMAQRRRAIPIRARPASSRSSATRPRPRVASARRWTASRTRRASRST